MHEMVIMCTIVCLVILGLAIAILVLVDKRCKNVKDNYKRSGMKYSLPAGGPFKLGQWQPGDSNVMNDCLSSSLGDGSSFFCQYQNSDGSWSHSVMDMTNNDQCPPGSIVALVPIDSNNPDGPGTCTHPLISGDLNNDLCCTDPNNCMQFPANQVCSTGAKCLSQPGILPGGLGYCPN